MNNTRENFELFEEISTLHGGMDFLHASNFAMQKLSEGREISAALIESFVTNERDEVTTVSLLKDLEHWVKSIPEKK